MNKIKVVTMFEELEELLAIAREENSPLTCLIKLVKANAKLAEIMNLLEYIS